MIKQLHSRLQNAHLDGLIMPVLVVVVVAGIGTYLLLSSHAATPYVSVTADSGTPTGAASVTQNCNGTTDNHCVTFGQAAGTGGGTQTTDCFNSPGACGYPDPNYNNNTGATSVGATSACSSLTPEPDGYDADTNGQTVQNMNITGGLAISASNVTVNNVCVTNTGSTPDYNDGVFAVTITSSASNVTLEHSTFAGTSATGLGVLDTGVANNSNDSGITANAIYIYNAAEAWHGTGTVNNSYMQAGATYTIPKGADGCDTSGGCGSHNEDVYISDTSWSGNHDTLLNSTEQTAVLFGDNDGGQKDEPADNQWILTNSLIAGGGWLMYLDANNGSMPIGTSTMDITGNRIARCLGPQDFDGNGTTCTTGTDKYGYFPNAGYYGGPVDDYCGDGANQIWSNNVWDDNSAPFTC